MLPCGYGNETFQPTKFLSLNDLGWREGGGKIFQIKKSATKVLARVA
jgi:hypothetical protein